MIALYFWGAIMGVKVLLSGKKFGRLFVLHERRQRDSQGLVVWKCQCECGALTDVAGAYLTKGNTKSCGCLQREAAAAMGHSSSTHGKSNTPTYQVWRSMLKRCDDVHNHNYGGRGIKVCNRWRSFQKFYEDMGCCPEGLTIERVNNNGHYTPTNCIWATQKEQGNNRRGNISIKWKGLTLTIAQWSEKLSLNRQTLYWRARQGWRSQKLFKRPV
jgi:hypothetical protein